jgi:hypothetical protein
MGTDHRVKHALLVGALTLACTPIPTSSDSGNNDSGADASILHANYKVAYATAAGYLSIYHSRDGSVEWWASWQSGVSIDPPNFGYRGDYLLVVRDQSTLNVLDSNGTVAGVQSRPANVAPIVEAVPRPDFSRVAIESTDDAGTYVGTLDADGGYKLLLDGGNNPIYAPDGRTLFVAQYTNGVSGCMLMRDDGSSTVPLPCYGVGGFSFDGKRMAYVRIVSPRAFLSVVDLTTMTSTDVGAPIEAIIGSPVFTPDGDAIVFVQHGQMTSTLQHMDIATGTVTTLIPVMLSGYLSIGHISIAAEP